VGEEDGGGCAVEFGGGIAGEGFGVFGDGEFLIAGAVGGVEAEELPAFVQEGVVAAVGEEGFVVAQAFYAAPEGAVGGAVVIAWDGVEGCREVGEDFACGLEFVAGAVFGEVSEDEDEFEVGDGVDLLDKAIEPGAVFRRGVVEVIEDGEGEACHEGIIAIEARSEKLNHKDAKG